MEYGVYKLILNATMYTQDGNTIAGTYSELKGFLQIDQCDIKAKILGGTGKAVSNKGDLLI